MVLIVMIFYQQHKDGKVRMMITKPYTQYIGDFASEFPVSMGKLCSSLSRNGWASEEIEDMLLNSRLVHEIEYGTNFAAADSSAVTLGALLSLEGYPIPEHLTTGESGEDWLMWWAVETAFWIARLDHISIKDVLQIMPLKDIFSLAVRYHTISQIAFYDEVFAIARKQREEE